MALIEVNGTRLYYEAHGEGNETLVFSHGLLMSAGMFSAQIEVLRGRCRCIAYDHRGQGRSEIAKAGYDMDNIARDAASLIRSLDAWPCHFVGLSMGGFVGLRLAIHHPELLRSLILLDTSADAERPENIKPYRRLAFIARWLGMGPVMDRVMGLMFGRTFLEDPERAEERDHWRGQIAGSNRRGMARAAHGVIDREGVYELLGRIRTPTLIIVGAEDVSTPPDRAERIHERIKGSELVVIPGAGHSASIEQADAVTRVISDFVSRVGA